ACALNTLWMKQTIFLSPNDGAQRDYPTLGLSRRIFMRIYGEIESLNICDNLADHMVGNVYAQLNMLQLLFRRLKEVFLQRSRTVDSVIGLTIRKPQLKKYKILKEIEQDLSGFKCGLAHFFLQHTSASLTINENYDSDVRDDTETFLNKIVPEGRSAPWKHTLEG
ncbi:hypothetical protein IFM89_027674, partial [Coptis chinensis]